MRWVAIILVALVLLGVWTLGLLVPEMRWIAEVVTALVVLVVVLVFVVRWAITRFKAAALERELTKQAAPKGAEKSPEVLALEAEMRAAVAALKKKRGGGGSALYKLPWYAIVGPPAVGKTTAFAQSGLSFIGTEAGAPKVRGSAGTRNCDWWFSDEAILLDTAGRFATQREDHDEWMAFLDTVHRVRPERPLDGLIVAVSVPEILTASDAEREGLATQLRERLDEVLDRLETVLPVYLLLTKADLIPGFVEFWSVLPKPQRSQVWGASFDLSDPRLAEPARAIEAELDALTAGLHGRLLQRLPQERSPERRTRIMQFPVEFEALRAPLAHFVGSLCRPAEGRELPLLRGFYLTSATQLGRPVDRVLAGMLRGFGAPELPAPAPVGEAQSYFVTDVFRSVILPDRNLAARSVAGTERRSRRELKSALVAVGLAAFVLIPAIVSYVHNTLLARGVDAATAALRSASTVNAAGSVGDPLEPMLDTLDRLDHEATGFGIPSWLVPRAAHDLREPLRKAYIERVHASLRLYVAPEIEKMLLESARTRNLPDPVNLAQNVTPRRAAYDTLRLYATLADPKGHVDPSWTPDRVAALWKKTLEAKTGGKAVDDARLKTHVTNYLAAIESDAFAQLRWPDAPMKDVRKNLRDVNREASQLAYHWALRAAYDVPPILAGDAFDQATLRYIECRGSVLVDGVFTKKGWLKVRATLDTALPNDARIEPWVLDDTRIPATEVALRQQIRKQYYDDYLGAWIGKSSSAPRGSAFLDKCSVVPQPANAPPSVLQAKLVALKGPEGFYRSFFGQFRDNVIADEPKKTEILGIAIPTPPEGCGSKIPGMAPRPVAPSAPEAEESPVQAMFHPFLVFSGDAKNEKGAGDVPLDKYLGELDNLSAMLETAGTAVDAAAAAEQNSHFSTTKHAIETLVIGSFVEPSRSKVSRLLMAPVETTKAVVQQIDDSGVGQDWKTGVWTFWHDQLSEKWPFNKRVADAASIADFDTFFKPGSGLLWAFVGKSLSSRVELKGNRWVAKAGADVPVRGDVLPCLNNAKEITDAFFSAEGDRALKIGVFVDWTATDVSDVKFLVEQKATPLVKEQWGQVTYTGENEVTLEWMEAGRKQSARGNRSFALYNLFWKTLGGLKPSDSSGIYVSQFPPLTIKVRGVGGVDPFRADFFSKLSCPDTLSEAAP